MNWLSRVHVSSIDAHRKIFNKTRFIRIDEPKVLLAVAYLDTNTTEVDHSSSEVIQGRMLRTCEGPQEPTFAEFVLRPQMPDNVMRSLQPGWLKGPHIYLNWDSFNTSQHQVQTRHSSGSSHSPSDAESPAQSESIFLMQHHRDRIYWGFFPLLCNRTHRLNIPLVVGCSEIHCAQVELV